MNFNVVKTSDLTVLEVLGDNGLPASAQNPINPVEYTTAVLPEIRQGILIISGMPMSAVAMLAVYYKNLFSVIAIANPRNGNAEVIHTLNSQYELGATIPLPTTQSK